MNAKFESETGLTSKDISVLRLSWQIRMGCSSEKSALQKPNESNHVTPYSSAFPASPLYRNSTQIDKPICSVTMNISARDAQHILHNDAPYDFPDNEYFTHEDIAGFDPQLGWIVGVINIMTDTVTTRNGDTYSIIQPKDFTNRQVGQRISIDVEYLRSLFESVSANESSLISAVIKQAEVLNMCPASMEEIQAILKVSSSIERQIRRLIEETEPYNNINPMVKYDASQSSRKQFFINQRITVTYCQYGDTRMKPTDIWTNHPDPKFKPMCHKGDPCHVSAPRGSKTGTQGLKGSKERSVIPALLCKHIVEICEESLRVQLLTTSLCA